MTGQEFKEKVVFLLELTETQGQSVCLMAVEIFEMEGVRKLLRDLIETLPKNVQLDSEQVRAMLGENLSAVDVLIAKRIEAVKSLAGIDVPLPPRERH